LQAGDLLRFTATGENIDGDQVVKSVALPIGGEGNVSKRLAKAGFGIQSSGSEVSIDFVAYDSPAYRQQIEYGWIITDLQVDAVRPSKYWVYLPVLGVLALIFINQKRRRRTSA
jgi:hypothetical protein